MATISMFANNRYSNNRATPRAYYFPVSGIHIGILYVPEYVVLESIRLLSMYKLYATALRREPLLRRIRGYKYKI